MNIKAFACIGFSLAVNVAHAGSMAGPESNWTNYDLLAKVEIRSMDLSRDILFSESPALKAYGQPVRVVVIDSIRAPGTNMDYIVLAPAYGIKKGERISFRNYEEGAFATTNSLAIGCKLLPNVEWLVIKDVLSEELWLKYMDQKSRGGVGEPSTSDLDELNRQVYEREEAIKQMEIIIEQSRRGEISEEEYQKRKMPLDIIFKKPLILPEIE